MLTLIRGLCDPFTRLPPLFAHQKGLQKAVFLERPKGQQVAQILRGVTLHCPVSLQKPDRGTCRRDSMAVQSLTNLCISTDESNWQHLSGASLG